MIDRRLEVKTDRGELHCVRLSAERIRFAIEFLGEEVEAAADRPAIVHVKTDVEAITSRITLTKLREQALAKQKH